MDVSKEADIKPKSKWYKAMRWIPTLYFAEGIPYAIVMTVAVVMYKRLGLDNESVALYTSWLYLPWVLKPFWSPIVDTLRTKRWWIVVMQCLIGVSMAGIAFTINGPSYVQWTLAFFWLLAFNSATHDIAADGFYMLALSTQEQALYVGIRSTFYRIALVSAQGLLIMFAGIMEIYTRQPKTAWAYTFALGALLFFLLFAYHLVVLPRVKKDDDRTPSLRGVVKQLGLTFATFFTKPGIITALAFMLLYRLPEALLTKICPMFLLDGYDKGGLGLSTSEIGLVQGTIGVIGLTLGGILGGILVMRNGLKRWLWPMVLSISLPNAVYIYMAYFQSESLTVIGSCVFVEQLGYGFGFTAYMMYLLYFSRGAFETAHYAFCTLFMALGMMLPGMGAGWLEEHIGYLNFFIVVMLLIPVTFLVSYFIKVDDDFGIKKANNDDTEEAQ